MTTSKKINTTHPKAGHPSSYRPEYAELARKFALLGATDERISELLEVSRSALARWKKRHPEFASALQSGKDFADSEVAESLYKSALGGHFVLEEKAISDGLGGFHIVTLKRQVPPNTTSQIFWLKNRQSRLWRDKVELEADVSQNVFPPKEVLDALYAKSMAQSAERDKILIGRRERLGIKLYQPNCEEKDNEELI